MAYTMSNIGRLSRFAPALAVSLVIVSPTQAYAEDCNDDTHLGTCIEADTLWPHAGPARFQSVGATETTAPKQFSFGLVTTYLRKPIVLRAASSNPSGTDIPAVDHLLDTTFLWAFGITDQIEASAAMPMTLYRTGSGISAFASTQARELPKTSLRDLRFGLAYAVIPRPRVFPGTHYALTTRFEAAVPTGEQQWFAGDRAPVWMPSVAADYRRGPWFAGVELGARLRQTTDLAGARIGSQGFASLGVGLDLLPQELLSATVEAFALPSLVGQTRLYRDPITQELASESSNRKQLPAEWLAGIRTAPTADGDVSFSLSGGTIIPLTSDSAVTAPAYRFVLGARYAPLERDSDDDRVRDRDDQCPPEKEDIDGFEDQDGCDDRDNDRDAVADLRDRCRDNPEDKDGFQDDDGCPELDDDNDGTPDAQDQCRFKAEDKDGFQDGDGCPDLDNDGDAIPDPQDRCPDGVEDKDGFNDADGCPDPDNDADAIADDKDRCPNSREDKDGFNDDDGCPDPDNDEDGIPDDKDRCTTDAETIDGKDDADGCPEPGARDRTAVTGASVTVTAPARFLPGQAAVSPQLRAQLRMLAQRVLGIQPLQSVIVETYADSQGASNRNDKLAADRADAIRQELIAAGIPTELLTVAVGDLTQKRFPQAPQYQVTVQRGTWK